MENTQQPALGTPCAGTIRLYRSQGHAFYRTHRSLHTAPSIHFQITKDSTENRDRLEKTWWTAGHRQEPFNLEYYDQIALPGEPWGILCSRDHPLAAQHPETVPLACLGRCP